MATQKRSLGSCNTPHPLRDSFFSPKRVVMPLWGKVTRGYVIFIPDITNCDFNPPPYPPLPRLLCLGEALFSD